MAILLTPVHLLVILLHSRPIFALSNSHPLVLVILVILLHSRPLLSCILGFSSSRILVLPHSCPLVILSDSRSLEFSHSRPVLSDSRPSSLVSSSRPLVVLPNSSPLGFSLFLSSRILAPRILVLLSFCHMVVLSHCCPHS